MRLSARYCSLALATLLAGCAGGGQIDLESRDISVTQSATPAGASPIGNAGTLVKAVGPSYVTITISKTFSNAQPNDPSGKSPITSGSGFVVGGDGMVMTAAHVAVKQGNAVSARAADGRVYSGKVVSILPDNDMALIRLRNFKGLAVTPVSNPCLAKGAAVFSLGKPHAQGDTARFGVVDSMSFGQAVRYGNFGYPDAMVTRMNTQKGESGGPLFDDSGRLAGMVVSTLSDGNGQSLNLAHVIPASRLAGFLCQSATCTQPWQILAASSKNSCG